MSKQLLPYLVLAATALSAATGSAGRQPGDTPFWAGKPDASTFLKVQDERLKRAQEALGRMLAVKGKRSVANTLGPYDETLAYLDAAGSQADLLAEVHPDENFRSVAERVSQKVEAFSDGLSLNREVYDALLSIDLTGADDETRYYVEKTLVEYRLAGVNKDEATRERIRVLRDELVLIGQEFSRNIRDDRRTVIVDDPSELEGLPADYIARHSPGPDGKITLTIDYPDSSPSSPTPLTRACASACTWNTTTALSRRTWPSWTAWSPSATP